jgi:hypothetical protein
VLPANVRVKVDLGVGWVAGGIHVVDAKAPDLVLFSDQGAVRIEKVQARMWS